MHWLRPRSLLAVCLPALLSVQIADAKPKRVREALGPVRSLAELESHAKALLDKKGEATDRFTDFMSFAGVVESCPASACKNISTARWMTTNLDGDADDEKVLSIVTSGDGRCTAQRMTVIVFDSVKGGFAASGHATLELSRAAAPTAEVLALPIHSGTAKDLVARLDGKCDAEGGSPASREQRIKMFAFDTGTLETIVSTEDWVQGRLVKYSATGSPPVTLELDDGKSKLKLLYDPVGHGYDPLPSYEVALKASVSTSDDDILSPSECASPITSNAVIDCGLSGSARVGVAVQRGKAIGTTVTTTPSQPDVIRCIRLSVAQATWKSTPGVSTCTRTFAMK